MSLMKRLGRSIAPIRNLHDSRNALAIALQVAEVRARNAEERARNLESQGGSMSGSPFFAYFTNFDALACMRRHEVHDRTPTAGFQTNWLGVLVDTKFFPFLADEGGKLDQFPLPANWHADIAEWASALHAVELARPDSFTMIELGCGWGCWMNNTGVAAKRTGRTVHVIGIEGDEGHLGFAHESLARNGFSPDEYTLHRGIAAATAGTALFPRQEHAGHSWGLEPVFGATQEQQDQAIATGSHDLLPMISLERAIGDRDRIDLLHIDIQGGEANLIESCMPILRERVAYVLIGTHSKYIEARLYDLFTSNDWSMEMERPAFYYINNWKPQLTVDGVQAWRNPRFIPAVDV
ncbi:FkbM family methyltransferase [Burkholderia sp. SRS-W-2-2016]|uniref:FkbM family methyltransferase n=1 Tax=Burkholderia sp. SRS-W-2-2016 TaxID=1926878 RepID=UPI00094B410B|nr:FkbM family methyltransferase [Burkholderia sp. SRS-W-2-2016]OLL30303.1 FkbM family methyltransferase [Burkholderia sp. SRS-W-2-2016]